MTASTGSSALVGLLETMEEDLAIRLIPAGMTLMLLQVSKTMRSAMQRVSPPAMIKVKRGHQPESLKNAMLNMMKCTMRKRARTSTKARADSAGRHRRSSALSCCSRRADAARHAPALVEPGPRGAPNRVLCARGRSESARGRRACRCVSMRAAR